MNVNKLLDQIEYGDQVADIAIGLVESGYTEQQLIDDLGGRLRHPLGNQLFNKFRDIQRDGWTVNFFNKRYP